MVCCCYQALKQLDELCAAVVAGFVCLCVPVRVCACVRTTHLSAVLVMPPVRACIHSANFRFAVARVHHNGRLRWQTLKRQKTANRGMHAVRICKRPNGQTR